MKKDVEECVNKRVMSFLKDKSLTIKALALQGVDEEEQKALLSVADFANAEEEKLRIAEYYKNEREIIIDEYTAKYKETNKKENSLEQKIYLL